jgi:hypothetical protein
LHWWNQVALDAGGLHGRQPIPRAPDAGQLMRRSGPKDLQSLAELSWTFADELPELRFGYGSIPINTIFRGMNIHKSQLF